MRRRARRWASAGVIAAAALAAAPGAQAQTPYYELGSVQCLSGGEMRVYPPPVMRPSDGSGPENVAWSPKIVVSTGGDNADYNTSAPWYQASTTSIGYGFTPYGRGFYGPRGQLTFVPFSGVAAGRYFVRHLLFWQGLGTYYAYGPGCDFFGPDGTLPLPAPAPAPAPSGPAASPSLFGSAAPSRLTWRRLRRGYTLRVRSMGARSRVSAQLSVGRHRLARRTKTAPSSGPVALTLRVSQSRLRRHVRVRARRATLVLTARTTAGRTYTTRHRVTLLRG